MIDIVKFYESIHARKLKIYPFNTDRNYWYLNNKYLKDISSRKILIVGYSTHSKYNTIGISELNKLPGVLHNYDLIVLDKYMCTLSIDEIKNIIDTLIIKKKSFIFSGYTTHLNMNINNHNKMFRPIDITKYPFNVKLEPIVINQQYSKKLILLYIACVLAILHGNSKDPRILYKFTLILLILLLFVFPKKKILYFNLSK